MLTAKLVLDRLDKDGRLLERKEQQSRSFVKNFIGLLYCAHAQITYGSPYTMTDISNTARTVDSQDNARGKANLMIGSTPGISGVACLYGYSAAAAFHPSTATIEGSKIGIQVGTGTTAVTPTDYAMETRIVHGTAASTFQYGGCELVDILFSGLSPHDGEFTIRRYFTNASGGSITVNEAGIYSVGTDTNAYSAWSFMIAHDIVSPGVAVADTEVLRVTYVPQTTV